MNKLLKALGLMRVSEHERLIEVARDEEQQTIDSLKAQLSGTGRDHVNLLAKFKKAITNLAAARCEVEELKGRHVYEKLRADEWKAIAEGFRPDALAMRRKRERDRDRRKGKV